MVIYFQIAGLYMELSLPTGMDVDTHLPSFLDFVARPPTAGAQIQVDLRIDDAPKTLEKRKLLSDTSITWGDRFRFEESPDFYITSVQNGDKASAWSMYSAKNFQKSTIYAPTEKEKVGKNNTSILSWLLMVAFGQGVLPFKTTLLHASVVEKDGAGFAFLGKSGTGKSTHSRLWMAHLADVSLLNDDNPAVKSEADGNVNIYGTPWSGKTPCYRNRGMKLTGLVRLQQATKNEWKSLLGAEAMLTILPSSTAIRWNRQRYDQMIDNLEEIVKYVKIGKLSCLPNEAAVRLCYHKLMNHIIQ